jgi:hypothetical protein
VRHASEVEEPLINAKSCRKISGSDKTRAGYLLFPFPQNSFRATLVSSKGIFIKSQNVVINQTSAINASRGKLKFVPRKDSEIFSSFPEVRKWLFDKKKIFVFRQPYISGWHD